MRGYENGCNIGNVPDCPDCDAYAKELERSTERCNEYVAKYDETKQLLSAAQDGAAYCFEELARVAKQRDALLAALEEVVDGLGFLSGGDWELEGLGISQERGKEIRAAIAQARGEKEGGQ